MTHDDSTSGGFGHLYEHLKIGQAMTHEPGAAKTPHCTGCIHPDGLNGETHQHGTVEHPAGEQTERERVLAAWPDAFETRSGIWRSNEGGYGPIFLARTWDAAARLPKPDSWRKP